MAGLTRDVGSGDGIDLAPNVAEDSRINILAVEEAGAQQMFPSKKHTVIEMESIEGSTAVVDQGLPASTVTADAGSKLGPSTDEMVDADSGYGKSARTVIIPAENPNERPLIVIIPRDGGNPRVIDPDAGRGMDQRPNRRRNEDGDDEIFYGDVAHIFEDPAVRSAFVRKVFLILSLQLAFSAAAICLVITDPEAILYVRQNWGIYLGAIIVFIATYLSLVCCESLRRSSPCNIIMLVLVTLSLTYLTVVISAFHETYIVLGAFAITAMVTITIVMLAICCPVDFTGCFGLLMVLFIVSMVVVLASLITSLVVGRIKWLEILVSAICAIVISFYLLWEIQLIMGGRRYSLEPDEVILAVLLLYVNIMTLFQYILMLLGLSRD